MRLIHSIKKMAEFSKRARLEGEAIGLVPTMGALHAGHLSLMRKARRENDKVVVSIFVNPIQFGPKEDYRKYPRNLRFDSMLCRKESVDVIFYPRLRQMYPPGYKTYITVEDLSDGLCGKFRPRHFQGVATVVAKLFNIINPNVAYFGQKDAQQAVIIKKMADDLNMPLKIRVMPTVRERTGLALSSRNAYLNKDEKSDALVLYQALNLARKSIRQGNRKSSGIIRRIRQLINTKKSASVQYISIVDLENLKPIDKIKGRVLIALAVFIGKARLIDNMIIYK